MYDNRVFDFIRTLKPSKRGELEITDLNNCYIKDGSLTYYKTKGEWIDAGTFDSLLRANNFFAGKAKKK
jgi:glucose-1-phosphate thymidylyltransferase